MSIIRMNYKNGGIDMNKFKKCLSLLLCFALVLSMLTANIITVSANETQTVHLLENGGFEQADEYGFPLNWDSDGKNLIPKGDFESGDLSAGYAMNGTTRVNYTNGSNYGEVVSVEPNGTNKPDGIGNYSLKIQWTQADKWGAAQVRNDYGLLPFAYGSEYVARATVKAGDNTHFPAAANRFQFCFNENVTNNTTNKQDFYVEDNSWIPTTTWQEFSKTFTTWNKSDVKEDQTPDAATSGTVHRRYQLRARTSATADAVMYVDKFSIEKISRTSNASAASGTKSLMVKGYADGLQEKWTSDYADVNVGETIGVGAKVNVSSIASYTFGSNAINPKVSVIAEFDNGATEEIASYTSATDGYVQEKKNVTVPQGATSVRLVFKVDGEGLVYFDDAEISIEKEIQEEIVDVSRYLNKIKNNGFETTDRYDFPTNWDSNGKNLLTNADFEKNSLAAGFALDGTTALTYARDGGVSAVSVVANDSSAPVELGKYALKLQWNQVKWGCAYIRNDTSGVMPVAFSSDYILRAYVKSDSNTHFPAAENKYQFYFIANYKNNSTGKYEFGVDSNSWIITDQWQEFSKTYTTAAKDEVTMDYPSAAYPFFKRFQIRSRTSGVANAVMYADNVRVEKVSRSDSTEKNTGNKSLKIVAYDDGVDEVWTSEKVSVKPGAQIAVGAAYKTLGSDSGAEISVNYYSGSTLVGKYTLTKSAKSDNWTSDVAIATVPSGADKAELEIKVAGKTGTVWIDDVLIGEKASDPYIEDVSYSLFDLYDNGGETLTVSVGVTNPNIATNVFVATALYNEGGSMVAIDAYSEPVAQNANNYVITRNIILPENVDLAGYYVKTFMWESLATLKPYGECYVFPNGTSTFTVNKVFQDGMILQRDKEISVYGLGTPGEPITVTMDNAKSTVTVDSEGEWVAILPSKPASTVGTTLTVSGRGDRTFTFDDVLMGDVFLVSGQSNAAFSISEVKDFTANPDSANDNIRVLGIYDIGNDRQPGSTVELKDLPTESQLNTADKTGITDPTWLKFEPKSTEYDILRDPLTRDTSAIGYYVAKNIQNELKEQTGDIVPVGVITAAVGGSRIERWIPAEVYDNDATLTADNAAQKSTLYNLMINPLTKFNVKGVLWYQGCANAASSVRYEKEMTYIIESWRDRFGDENLPFIIHQLAGYGDQYALVRDSQRAVAKAMDNVDLTVLIDAGNKTDVHPQAKITAANRTAGIVLDKWYGISNNDGKFADFSKAENTVYNGKNGLKIYFENVVDGFYTVNKNGEKDSSAAPGGFLIADASGEFKVANVVINDDDTITIWNEAVTNPAYVRYAFEGFPYPEFANIYTGNGLPVTPFRNDNINVEWQYERATIGSNVNMVLNGDFEKATENGTTFTQYFQHRATNTSYGQFTIGFWDSVTEKYGKTYASATLKNGTGNASTEVQTALTGAKENMRLPMKPGKYIIEADVEATFTDESTYLCMGWNYFNNNEVQTGARKHSTDASEWRVTKSTNGMEHIVGEITIGEEYEGCYFYAFGLNLYTKSSEEQSVKVDNLVIRRAE